MASPWNLGPPSIDFSPLGNLGKTYQGALDGFRKRELEDQQRQTFASLGSDLERGDFAGAARKVAGLGDLGGATSLLGYGLKAKEQEREAEWLKNNGSVLGISTGGAPSASPAASTSGVPTSLIQNESGGRWDAQNNATGAGGMKGHFGRLQFGQARLQEAAAAGAIPPGTTPQQFMASPELQQSAEKWHFADIDQSIKANGFDSLVGKTLNGVPITVDGMRAVAHLGGKEGLRKFIETNGAYNPADANGTRLSDYFARHGGGGDTVPAPTAVASAPLPVISGNAPVQAVQGDDPARLEADAAYYDRTNPEAARQMRARAAALRGQEPAQVAAAPFQPGDAPVGALQVPPAAPRPVQMAQAAPQPGAPVADVPAQGAAPAQGFTIPGTGEVVEKSIADDPRVRSLSNALLGAPEKFKAGIQARLNLIVEELKAKRAEEAPTSSIKEYRQYRQDEAAAGRKPEDFTAWKRGNTASGASSVTVKNEGTIPPGYRVKRDAQGNATELEPIPGGPAAAKVDAAGKKESEGKRQSEMTGNVVLTALDDVERLMKEATLPTTGALGSRVAEMKGTAAHDIKNALGTVGANITFENLKQMRAASPTGGALGNVTEKEGEMLQNAWGALNQSQSEGQFKANLGRVRAIFERVVHGRTLSAQERKGGGPMTIERAKSLREEAAAAIAGGAPKEEVTKRLKEKYGITPEGL